MAWQAQMQAHAQAAAQGGMYPQPNHPGWPQ
jgi:hypothetical protein